MPRQKIYGFINPVTASVYHSKVGFMIILELNEKNDKSIKCIHLHIFEITLSFVFIAIQK